MCTKLVYWADWQDWSIGQITNVVPNWSIGQTEPPLRNHSVSSVSHPAEVDNGGFGDLGFD